MRYRIGWKLQSSMAKVRAKALLSAASRRERDRLVRAAEAYGPSFQSSDDGRPLGRIADLS